VRKNDNPKTQVPTPNLGTLLVVLTREWGKVCSFDRREWLKTRGPLCPGHPPVLRKGHLHFITFSGYRRLPLLRTVRARDIFVKELGKARDEMGFHLIGYVVMPEHVHLLLSEPEPGTPSTVLQKSKLRVARKMQKRRRSLCAGQLRLAFEEKREPLRASWQARFYDFNVYTKGKKTEKLNYMHANPVIRALVKHPKDWPWSSWSFYGKGEPGLVRMDVAA
jgi:REP-associated tyrosine transposase